LLELPNLHAKLAIVPGVGASIGSQNFTSRGANVNLEATVVLSDPAVVAALRERVAGWLALCTASRVRRVPGLRPRKRYGPDGCATFQ
jgi:phosphatidylserine/phosphatidylglycerophosphate/cardiolipin synthase-like enzyme